MKTKNIFFTLALVIVLGACKNKEVSEFTDFPIVQSYLKPGDYMQVNISRQTPFSANAKYAADDINALNIFVDYNNVRYKLTPLGNGQYIDSALVVVAGARYSITFEYNNKTVSAYSTIPSKPTGFTQSATTISIVHMDSTSTPWSNPTGYTPPTPINLTWTNSDNSYYLVVIENMETTLTPIRDFKVGFTPPGNRFRKQPTTASGLEIRSQEFQYYGKHRIILFHVLPDYASLYDQSSTTSQNLTNPSTSITNGYGIFTGLNSDTLYINVTQP